jgi:hypothetical protein
MGKFSGQRKLFAPAFRTTGPDRTLRECIGWWGWTCLFLICLAGCGTTQQRIATEQIVVSDAVDQAIAKIDFRPLTGRNVYLDTSYLRTLRTDGFINADYVTSALRQHLLAANCLLQDSRDEAEVIVEARIGTMGTNRHEVVYGIPQSNGLNAAASVMTSQPLLPTIPELSVARSDTTIGMSKLAVFAYDRVTKTPIWQSGTSRAESTAKSTWLLGAGPFQRGSVFKGGYRFAGENITPEREIDPTNPQVEFASEFLFSTTPRTAAVEESTTDSPAKR